MTKWKCYTKI